MAENEEPQDEFEDEFEVETVVYDNFSNQALGGGSIIVHTKKVHTKK